MKPRKWVIVVFACLLIAAGGVVICVTRLEKNRDIERILVARLSAATGGEFSVGRIRLGFFSVYLQNVSASLSTHSYNATIHDIQVAFSLWKLVATRGDFARSISKIIFISPALDIRLSSPSPNQPSSRFSKMGTSALVSIFKNFPVRYLLVRKGIVRLWTGQKDCIVLGEALAGRVWDEDKAVMVELRGTMASTKKNLFVSAAFSKTGERHRVSLRLDKARIQRPLVFRGASVASGQFDGVFEFSFPDSVTVTSFESTGWLHISHGTCTVAGYTAPVSSVMLSCALTNTTVIVDSLTCETAGSIVSARGSWDCAGIDSNESAITVRATGIRVAAFPGLPKFIAQNLSGTAWIQGKLTKRRGEVSAKYSLAAGGITAFSLPLASLECRGSVDPAQLTADTIQMRGPAFRCMASGIAAYEKSPVAYSLSFDAALDSLKNTPAVRGQVSVNGTLRGLGSSYVLDAVASSRAFAVNGIRIGSPSLHIATSNGKGISFSTLPGNTEYFSATGIVDSFSAASPLLYCNASAGPRLLKECLGVVNPSLAERFDSSWADIAFKGAANAFSAHGQAGIVVSPAGGIPGVRGGIEFQLDKAGNDKAIRWRISQKGLAVADTLVPLRAEGALYGDSLRIDSIASLSWLHGAGLIRFGSSMDFSAKCLAAPVSSLNRIFCGGRLPLSAGTISGSVRITGGPERIRTDSDLHLRGAAVAAFTGLEADAVIQIRDSLFTVFPFTIRHNGLPLVSVDTVTNRNGLHFSGGIKNADVAELLGPYLPEDFRDNHEIRGTVSCNVSSGQNGEALATLRSDMLTLDSWRLDNIRASAKVDGKGVRITSFSAHDSTRASISASGYFPWSIFSESDDSGDTLDAAAHVDGDLVASVGRNVGVPLSFPLSGSGVGVIDVALRGTRQNMRLTRASIKVPHGILKVKPYVPEDIRDFSMSMSLDNASAAPDSDDDNTFSVASITTELSGVVSRRSIRIHSTHVIPRGFEPLTLGFLDFGALLVSTPKRGIDVHVPGIMEIGASGDVEFAARSPFPEFALSGPLDKLCVSGTWIMRSSDITFPALDNVETRVKFDPFPYITWNLDLRAGNRKVMYYYDTGKNRKLMRFAECYIDPTSILSLRGRVLDNSFKVLGELRSNSGSVFFGRTFDRNLDVGLEFVPQALGPGQGYDNTPIIWGSAEAMSDTSRFDRVKLTVLVRDSVTGAWTEHGRFYDPHFRVGNDIENLPGATERQFATDEGSKYGSLSGAGQFVSEMGEQYLHRFLLQNLERRLAKSLGLDVINVETSIASNYFNKFYTRQLEWNKWDYLTLANVGVTVGRYVFYDKVFLKWRTELVPVDTVLRPQYDFGFEFQPLQPILLDVNYGIYKGEKSLEATPTVNLLLQLPIRDVRKLLDF